MCEQKRTGHIVPEGSVTAELSASPALRGQALEGGGGVSWQIGAGLVLEHGVLRVDAAERVEEDNTRPVTSAAVYLELGNVEALLANL